MSASLVHNTEWLIKLRSFGEPEASRVVVYRTEELVDEDEDVYELKKVWVVGCARVGRGYEDYSGLLSWGEDGKPIVTGCQYAAPDMYNFRSHDDDDDDDSKPISDSDLDVINELWERFYQLCERDVTDDDTLNFVAKVDIPDDVDFVTSEGWEPDDLLEPVAEVWNLGLRF
jgi:hypothetical protein